MYQAIRLGTGFVDIAFTASIRGHKELSALSALRVAIDRRVFNEFDSMPAAFGVPAKGRGRMGSGRTWASFLREGDTGNPSGSSQQAPTAIEPALDGDEPFLA